MRLVERHFINKSHSLWEQCDHLAMLSKNLYNASLYDVRQYYFSNKKYKSWQQQRVEFVRNNNPDYRALPSKVAGEVVQQVGRSFGSFFSLLKKKNAGKYDKPVKLPKYLDKNGRNIVVFAKDTLSKRVVEVSPGLFEHVVCGRDLNFRVLSRYKVVDNIRIVPSRSCYVIEVVYSVDDVDLLKDNGRYASVDLGVNNFAAVFFNTGDAPVLFSGLHLKSINQFFNKSLALARSNLREGVKSSKRIERLFAKREHKLDWELHYLSRLLVNRLVSVGVCRVVVGCNPGWKQDINIGRVNNQKFVMLPFARFIDLLDYKCAQVGIEVVRSDESYTSKASFLDRDFVPSFVEGGHGHYLFSGRRVKRGLYRSKGGVLISADVNGAGNTLRKVVPDDVVYFEGIEVVAVQPERVIVPFKNVRLS